ncbi:MAG: NAD(P)/FAD-dependent oxidoreductase [Rikenellaceae bacterium]
MSKYDIVIIGSGLGGLECATILSKEGYNVCVVEKNPIFGGCLQSFKRGGLLLDTGIHYVGSMDNGQILNQYFNYFGLLPRLKMKRLDNDAFDVVCYEGQEYNYAQGYGNFADTMATYFPDEERNIRKYTAEIEKICTLISVENLKKGIIHNDGLSYFQMSASRMIDQSVDNEKLRNILAGTATLYGGMRDYSTLYHHAVISGSNLEGAYRFLDGSQQVADELIDIIKTNGGTVRASAEVTRMVVENGKITGVEINHLERIEANYFISNIHPKRTFELVDKTNSIKKAYLTRINSLQNSYGLFSVYLILKKNKFPYINRNYYLHGGNDSWCSAENRNAGEVKFALLSSQATGNCAYSEVVTVLCPMDISEIAKWNNTTVNHRGADYEEFKQRKTEEILNFVFRYKPELKGCIDKIYTATPLTYRDYTATADGSAYGIMKNCNSLLTTLIPTRTKIENLYLTGQNLNVHGALGVTLTAALTCAEFLGTEYLAKKIGGV